MKSHIDHEIVTQKRLIKLFTENLGYDYLGDWKERSNNNNIEEDLLEDNLKKRGYEKIIINKAIQALKQKSNKPNESLYQINKEVYELIRYGLQVKKDITSQTETVHLIDWENIQSNDFKVAEEVTLKGNLERRPDIVVYINGIAIAVIELKRSNISINEGIRQCISNQQNRFNKWFYSTVQFVIAGNDSEGLKYGTIKTPENSFLKWKEEENENESFKLDKYISKLFEKERILDLIYNFILFDAGKKKVPRPHQYFAIKEAQKNIQEKKGGIIWHTQGSGKSIVMVLLAKWIMETIAGSRVVIITDRDELDKQIEDVFYFTGEKIKKAKSGKDLFEKLKNPSPRLLCSLIHKFGGRGEINNEKEIIERKNEIVSENIFVFIDECHRTQSGKLHKYMKSYLPNSIFIGFTGTPLLKEDRPTSLETFGSYIHQYLLEEAVEDKVILDILYEARDIDQYLGSKEKIDSWFEIKTKGLNEWQKIALKKKWSSLQTILSSESRISRICNDIIFDFSIKPRLSNDRGTALLVVNSIYEGCKYYEFFDKSDLKNKFALITSYNPHGSDISLEDTGANSETDKEFIYKTYEKILKDISPAPNKTKSETYEDQAKKKFIKEPHNTKLLIVVDKLLTGFDAPSCTYLYIDKSMQDHGLFQAICRTNRPDGEDKDYGYIVDYKNLLKKVEEAISVYSSELDNDQNGKKVKIDIHDKLKICFTKLNECLEALDTLCGDIKTPKNTLNIILFFCGNSENPADLEKNKIKRQKLYKLTSILLRTFSNIAGDLDSVGDSSEKIEKIKNKVKEYRDLRDTVKNASGEYLDLKPYEADMRHLIDKYIEASDAQKISNFENNSLVELIVKSGISEILKEKFQKKMKDKNEVSEIVENNFRNTLLLKKTIDPNFYNQMSTILSNIILERKNNAIDYENYLKKMEILAQKLSQENISDYPPLINNSELRTLYNNLLNDEEKTLKLDKNLKLNIPSDWRGVTPKEQVVKQLIYEVVNDSSEVERLFEIIKQQDSY